MALLPSRNYHSFIYLFFSFFGPAAGHVGILVPQPEIEPMCGGLITTGLPGNSHHSFKYKS